MGSIASPPQKGTIVSTSCGVAGTDTYVWNLLVQYILGSIGKDGVVILTGRSLVPRPRPAFRRLRNCSTVKLGGAWERG